jgi:hypothetical protein
MKFSILIVLVLMLSGCGRFNRFMAGLTGDATETCVDGVMYLQFTSGATVKYTVDQFGNYSIVKCQ